MCHGGPDCQCFCPNCGEHLERCECEDDGPGATECKCCREPLTGGELAGGLCLPCENGDFPDCR